MKRATFPPHTRWPPFSSCHPLRLLNVFLCSSLLFMTTSAAPPLCSVPHPLFASPLFIFSNLTFPLSPHPTPFPASSFLPRCPNLNSTLGSCCDQASIDFTTAFISNFTTQRDLLLSSFSSLTLHSLYSTLTNTSRHANLTLSSGQSSALSTVLTIIHSWVNTSTTCIDHWMGYLTSLLCLACDPLHATSPYYTATPFALLSPILTLHSSTCSSIYSHCSPFLTSFFEQLPVLQRALLTFIDMTPLYHTNNSTSLYYRYYYGSLTFLFDGQIDKLLNVDLCSYQDNSTLQTDCQHAFCVGSPVWPLQDSYWERSAALSPHAFRGMNYGWGVTTWDQLVNFNALFGDVVCIMRMAYNATREWGLQSDVPPTADGCPLEANLLHLLFPHTYPPTPPITSAYLLVHNSPLPATDCEHDYLSTPFTHPSDPACSLSGYAAPVWVNDSDSRGWAAYEVGCGLGLSDVICGRGEGGEGGGVEGVGEMLRVGFVVFVGVGLTGLVGLVMGLAVKYRGEREERGRAELGESLDPDQHWWEGSNEEEDEASGAAGYGLSLDSPRGSHPSAFR